MRRAKEKNDKVYNMQFAICFESSNQKGESYWISNEIRNLSSVGWNDKFSSCCFNGVWIFYEDVDFNEFSPNVSKILSSL